MGHTSKNIEANDSECDLMNCEALDQEVTEKSFSRFPRNHSCDILVKIVAAFWLCQKKLA